jgi:magnesium transporter
MARTFKRQKAKRPGASPGTLEFTGEQRMGEPLVVRVRYNETIFDVSPAAGKETPAALTGQVTWYDLRGLHDISLVERFGQAFNIHPLVLEDVLNTTQRPKFEEYGSEVFIIITALIYDETLFELHTEQIAIYFSENYLITFQEIQDDTFVAIRERLHSAKRRIRNRKADYLAYALIDNVVDNYFVVLDKIEAQMELLEQEITTRPTKLTKEKIHQLKFQMLAIRKAVMPLREAIGKFARCESNCVEENTGLFLRDLNDHVFRINDLVETYRDMLTGLQDLYLSELSLRMNNVIQVLTIITTIFVPLTFLAGIYGMNFDNMPELHWTNGYFYLLGFMALISLGLIVYFKRKQWV